MEKKLHQRTLNDREIEFLIHHCSDCDLKEIAKKMFISVRTAENYSYQIRLKLNIQTRQGLVLYAIEKGIVEIMFLEDKRSVFIKNEITDEEILDSIAKYKTKTQIYL